MNAVKSSKLTRKPRISASQKRKMILLVENHFIRTKGQSTNVCFKDIDDTTWEYFAMILNTMGPRKTAKDWCNSFYFMTNRVRKTVEKLRETGVDPKEKLPALDYKIFKMLPVEHDGWTDGFDEFAGVAISSNGPTFVANTNNESVRKWELVAGSPKELEEYSSEPLIQVDGEIGVMDDFDDSTMIPDESNNCDTPIHRAPFTSGFTSFPDIDGQYAFMHDTEAYSHTSDRDVDEEVDQNITNSSSPVDEIIRKTAESFDEEMDRLDYPIMIDSNDLLSLPMEGSVHRITSSGFPPLPHRADNLTSPVRSSDIDSSSANVLRQNRETNVQDIDVDVVQHITSRSSSADREIGRESPEETVGSEYLNANNSNDQDPSSMQDEVLHRSLNYYQASKHNPSTRRSMETLTRDFDATSDDDQEMDSFPIATDSNDALLLSMGVSTHRITSINRLPSSQRSESKNLTASSHRPSSSANILGRTNQASARYIGAERDQSVHITSPSVALPSSSGSSLPHSTHRLSNIVSSNDKVKNHASAVQQASSNLSCHSPAEKLQKSNDSAGVKSVRVSEVQKERLVQLVLNNFLKLVGPFSSSGGALMKTNLWKEIATELNELGPPKTAKQWKATFDTIKSNAKAKLANNHNKDERAQKHCLSRLEEKIISAYGMDLIDGYQSVGEAGFTYQKRHTSFDMVQHSMRSQEESVEDANRNHSQMMYMIDRNHIESISILNSTLKAFTDVARELVRKMYEK